MVERDAAAHLVRIGGASGAWGDSPRAIAQLLTCQVDYMMMDYLAEVTMSLLARARMKDPQAGFPGDFVDYLKPHLKVIAERGIKVVSNAGGVNPEACKRALEAVCSELGIALKVAVVTGDDLLPRVEELRAEGVREWVSGELLPERMLTANAYLGAIPIAQALERGADIVVTGRCADSALGLGILMHEFGWKDDDYDLLAAGTLVGHVLECGPQATGGVFTDWEKVPGWHDIGYPLAECSADGSFVLTKPPGTGGLIDTACVAEQVLYEIGDPRAYILPDVVADFSRVTLTQEGADRVRVTGAIGRAPTSQYKVSATYQDGYRAVAMAVIIGKDAVTKAERSAQALIERAEMTFRQRGLSGFTRVHIEALGGEASYAGQSRARESREVVMRLVVEEVGDGLPGRVLAGNASGVAVAQGAGGKVLRHAGHPRHDGRIELRTFGHQRGPIGLQHVSEAKACRHLQQVALQCREVHALLRHAAQPDLIGQHQVVQQIVDGAEKSTPVELALLVAQLFAGAVEPVVEPLVVAGKVVVVGSEGLAHGDPLKAKIVHRDWPCRSTMMQYFTLPRA